MAKVLIAGCGDVGIELGSRLAADGHVVWGLRRSSGRLPEPLRAVQADLGDPQSLESLPAGIEHVFYTAAADAFDDASYRKAYLEGLTNLLGLLTARGDPIRRIIFVSSTGVYGQTSGEWVDEDSPTEPLGFSGQRLLEGERALLSAGLAAVVVRFGGIYGPGRSRLINRVRGGAPCVSEPPQYTNRIHRDDCAGVLRHLMSLASPESVYLGVDDEPAPQCAVMEWLASRLGVPPPAREALSKAAARGNRRCSNQRLRDSGYRFEYPSFREGYSTLVGRTRESE